MVDVIAVGDYCFDLIFTGLPHLPGLGTELFGDRCSIVPGGAYNTVVAMHRLGVDVAWATDFGKDDFSQFVLTQAHQEGLKENLFVFHKRALRHITIAASFPQDRAFISYADPEPLVPSGVKALLLKSVRAFYIPGLYYGPWFLIAAVVAKMKGISIIMDGNSSNETLANTKSLAGILSKVDLFMPNSGEACRLTGTQNVMDAMAKLAPLCPCVVIKDGANGAYASKLGQMHHSPAIPVLPVDTTGAGDCFNAGFIKGWLDGLPIDTCLRWGNIVGGLSTLSFGGTGAVVQQKNVEEWLAKTQSTL